MLEVDFYIMPKITAEVNLELNRRIHIRKQFWMALRQMIEFGPDLASLRAVVNIMAFIAISKDIVIFSAVDTLR